jgi:hypothetical protein
MFFSVLQTDSKNALLAQLDRVTGFEPVGREFESLRARHFYLSGLPLCVESLVTLAIKMLFQ